MGATSAGHVQEELLAVIDRGAAVLIADLATTLSLDHSGAEALARVYQQAVARGTELRLVITAPQVRRAIALSGLDRLVAVFPALQAARDAPQLAVVVPLPARTDPATPALVPGTGPLADLPVTDPARPFADPARPGGPGHAPRPDMPDMEPEAALMLITGGIFYAGLILNDALDQPAAALRRAAVRVLDVLGDTVRDARTAALAGLGHGENGIEPDPVTEAESDPVSGLLKAAGEDLVHLSRLRVQEAAQNRARSRQARVRVLELAARAAAAQDRAAMALSLAATRRPGQAADLQARSHVAANHATRMRQWARDHPVGR